MEQHDCGHNHDDDEQADDNRWFKQAPWPERFEGGWSNMSKEHKREFMDESWQNHLKDHYEYALEFHGVEGVPWEELGQDAKDSVEISVRQHAKDMQEFGHALASDVPNAIEKAGQILIKKKQ